MFSLFSRLFPHFRGTEHIALEGERVVSQLLLLSTDTRGREEGNAQDAQNVGAESGVWEMRQPVAPPILSFPTQIDLFFSLPSSHASSHNTRHQLSHRDQTSLEQRLVSFISHLVNYTSTGIQGLFFYSSETTLHQ